nr:hypothetical protein Iba_chr09eCG4540 [Ipomoea batatas]
MVKLSNFHVLLEDNIVEAAIILGVQSKDMESSFVELPEILSGLNNRITFSAAIICFCLRLSSRIKFLQKAEPTMSHQESILKRMIHSVRRWARYATTQGRRASCNSIATVPDVHSATLLACSTQHDNS